MRVDNSPDAPEVILRTEALSAGYGTVPVIRDINLSVSVGEVVVLLGANGAGKSTTLRAVAGLLPSLTGRVHFAGASAAQPLCRRSRAGLAYVPEERGIFSRLTALENLRLGRGTVDAAVTLMPELKPLLSRRAGLLSGGEQQMLALARALAGEPKLLVCDELSLGLAPLIVERLLAALRDASASGVAVLLVEQKARAALAVADRAYVLSRGSVVLSGTAGELLSRFSEVEAHYLSAVG
jgi:branched-chain amino acid transport system ATP-binding protein